MRRSAIGRAAGRIRVVDRPRRNLLVDVSSEGNMASKSAEKTALRNIVVPRAKVWLEVNGDYVFGHGISEILKAVQRTGSIKAAAGDLGKSYRYVWAKIKETEETLGEPLVHTQIGGAGTRRSDLSELACELVSRFDTLRERIRQFVEHEYNESLRPLLTRRR